MDATALTKAYQDIRDLEELRDKYAEEHQKSKIEINRLQRELDSVSHGLDVEQRGVTKIKIHFEEFQTEHETLKAQKDGVSKDNKELQSQISALRQEAQLSCQTTEARKGRYPTLKQQYGVLTQQVSGIEAERQKQKNDCQANDYERALLQKELDDALSQSWTHEAIIQAEKRRNAELQKDLNNINKRNDGLREEFQNHDDKLLKHQKQVKDLENETHTLSIDMKASQQRHQDAQQDLQAAKNAQVAMRRKHEKLVQDLNNSHVLKSAFSKISFQRPNKPTQILSRQYE
jgi:chromosome segregation ATPase